MRTTTNGRVPIVGAGRRFADPLPSLVEQTPREHLHRWEIRDRKPRKQWSKGRVTLERVDVRATAATA